ncbi:hypothetical protein NQ317_007078 [Molorchus minor]|uniref:Integrin beta n=1 Tax=Molorchus minor TaxID=1323400 RepID=A0ABQ9K3V2_9CUCU|nr:hypothetical protein NQ317_007078 [Molorchus minor]
MDVPSTKHILTNCLIVSVISTIVIAQIPQRYSLPPNVCTLKETCHECIQTPSCSWCFDPDYINSPRCFQPSTSLQPNALCPEEYVFNPDNVLSVIENLTLSETGGIYAGSGSIEESGSGTFSGSVNSGSGGIPEVPKRIVQVSPQRLHLKLRARQSDRFTMSYKQAQDYPLDLYYLMDLSSSMHDDKENLSKLGNKLVLTMKNLTSDFRLGFGSFVDKVVMPYVSTLKQKLQHPCEICVAPYGFRHHMSLSINTHNFSTEVDRAQVSGNLDAPEGGFDAIMQAVVCPEIGWRLQARRLLVFSTDASFHYAGDGKLGGIVKPNDGECHMDNNGYYSQSIYQDYPSIEQINLSIRKKSINAIFAVTNSTISIYRELAKSIEGASVGVLEGDSSNIVDLIVEQYKKISSTVSLKHNASSAVSLKFFSSCLNPDGILLNTNECSGLRVVGDTVDFKVEIEVLKCPKNPKDHFQTIQIRPVGINETLIIDLEMLCECPCEKNGQRNSPRCSSAGTYKCGVCDCNPGAFGTKCECHTGGDIRNVTMNCINPNTTVECSGRGDCVCGHCVCRERPNKLEMITGKFCECDNFSCERHNGKLCSDHGECICGKCQCNPGWKGSNCACQDSTDSCKPATLKGDTLCSGAGTCECGVCVCNVTDNGRFTGKFCEKCPTCGDRCLEFKDCVRCQQYKTGPLKGNECGSNCTLFIPVPAKEPVVANEENGEVLCHYEDEEGCRFNFIYFYDEKQVLVVKAQEQRDCPPTVHIPAIILGVIAAVVLIGLAILLLWKLLTTIHDRREFARFEKEKMMAKWDTINGENPIYKQATSTFKNPTYSGKGNPCAQKRDFTYTVSILNYLDQSSVD